MDPNSPLHGASTTSNASMPSSPGVASSKIVTSLIIDFTPIWGPRVRRKVGGSGELSLEEQDWLVQFITKDLLHMQQAASLRKSEEVSTPPAVSKKASRSSVQQVSPSAAASTAVGVGETMDLPTSNGAGVDPLDDTCFVKVLCMDQLHVAVVVMFFSIEDESNDPSASAHLFQSTGMSQSHMYAVAIAIQNFSAIRLRVALPSIRDWMFHAHQEILALAFDEDWHAVTSLPAQNTGGTSNTATSSSSAGSNPPPTGTPVFVVGKGSPRLSAAEIIRQFETLLRPTQRVKSTSSTPRLKHGLAASDTAAAAAAIAAAAAASSGSIPRDDAEPATIDVEEEWYAKLCLFNPLLDSWIREHVDREKIDMEGTIFRRSDWSASQLSGILTAALAHHRCVIRADDPDTVTLWLNTLSLFYSDDRLLFASTKCFQPFSVCGNTIGQQGSCIPPALWSPILAADLNLQGTTATVNDILERYHEFRYPPVIIDVGRRLDESAHFFPTMTLTVFTEMRRLIYSRKKQIRPAWDILHSKSRPAALRHASLISTIVQRLKLISQAVAAQSYSTLQNTYTPQPSDVYALPGNGFPRTPQQTPRLSVAQPPRVSPGTLHGNNVLLPPAIGVHAPVDGVPNVSFATQVELPGLGSYGSNGHLTIERQQRAVLDAISHWRKMLLLRAMGMYVQEVELHKSLVDNKELAALFRISEADHKLLCVAVDFVSQVQQAKERRVRTVLVEAMTW